VVNEVRDYATVFLDGRQVGTLDRRLNQSSISVDLPAGTNALDILVENLGRINFGPQLREDRKGITQSVMLDGHELHGWKIYPLPMNDPDSLDFSTSVAAAPAFYRGTFHLNQTGDTFLDVSALGIGAVWINGYNLGRFWNIGPQQTLYVPGIWLKKGKNDVIVFDIQDDSKITLVGRSQAILNRLK
ncbi:MAG TPA: beta galactosidase jelly roll domain-containing protein, partial [Candidatus Acidoferrales bacterium]|nr:beta galactosidase jelly roll domain-containing protein [Candidatus Acidoferrales bacterium]